MQKGKKWSYEEGGCEGISPARAIVDRTQIESNLEMQRYFERRMDFQYERAEKERYHTSVLICNHLIFTNSITLMIQRTKLWASEFVVKYTLCPFAERALQTNVVRYITTPATTASELSHVFRKEANLLLRSDEEDISTTLIIADLFYPRDFVEFYSFCQELELVRHLI